MRASDAEDGAPAPEVGTLRERREPAAETAPGEAHAIFVNEAWEARFPGLAAGITAAGGTADFGLTTAPSAWALAERMETLCRQLGFEAAAVARQVHGREVRHVRYAPGSGLLLVGAADGLVTERAGVLLTVTAADCVPVYLVDPGTRALGLLHAGWRGAAAGVLAAGLAALDRELGVDVADLHLHLGPAICGACYEVGPEVLEAFGRRAPRAPAQEAPAGPGADRADGTSRARLDLRAELARRAEALGLPPDHISRSPWCTRCDGDQFHSHRGRGSEAGRMAAYMGWTGRDAPGGRAP